MKDRLEEYIKKNKEAFNDDFYGEKLWKSIQKQKQAKEVVQFPFTKLLKIAATALIVVSFGFLLKQNLIAPNHTMSSIEKVEASEKEYAKLVSNKLNEIPDSKKNTKLLKEMALIDTITSELKNELLLHSHVNSEKVVKAMMKNYQTKLDILENILVKMEENSIQPEKDTKIIY
jgi:hypothetical protein